ncbi:hypothetical protein Pmani_004883 [Petrolisthes manimaculis]|uniref:Uncharacterized protein n=1 Tax=Petrolisthes manimaculis TaxID=1843537 RepID=A0AAE1Q720_9EUCA|nr:hypothetical protein Pmani_008286 [Petrolisthes manimaculis]KAK4324476.1 hypothetical protein Pmani_004883 [Petrolisthes manimaculis]
MPPQVRLHLMSQPDLSLQKYGELVDTLVEVQADHVGIALSTADPHLPLPLSAVPNGSTTVIVVLQPQPQPMSTPFLEANKMLQQLDMVMGTVIRLHINNNYKCLLHSTTTTSSIGTTHWANTTTPVVILN